jgi:hypothetical protein
MRFGAVALSVTSSASVAISRLSARYVSIEILLFLERGEQRSNSRKSFKVPVMVDLGKVFTSAAWPRLDNSLMTGSVGTGSRYEEGKYSGFMDLVLNLRVAQFSPMTRTLTPSVPGPSMR